MAKVLNRDAVPFEPTRQPKLLPVTTCAWPPAYQFSSYDSPCFLRQGVVYCSYNILYQPRPNVQKHYSAIGYSVGHEYGVVCGGGGGGGGGGRKMVESCKEVKKKFVPRRLRIARGRPQWKPKKSKSDECVVGFGGGAGAGVGGAVQTSSSVPLLPPSPTANISVSDKTTVMIRNIPNQYRRSMLIEFLDKHCEKNQLGYDFVYLPMDFMTRNNVGYAFVNFTTPAAAKMIGELLQDHKWGCIQTATGNYMSKKICQVTWARIQGKEALVRHFQNSNFCCSESEWLPVVFSPPRNGLASTSSPSTIGKCRA